MDLSGIIFVVLAIGWAVYLLPKALNHHDDLDQSRPVEEFSGSVRVLGRGVVPPPVVPSAPEPVEARPSAPAISRQAARAAARRRRRVLALLLSTLVAVAVTSALSYTPWFTIAIPGGLVVAFLVVARLTVRAQQVRRVAPVQHQIAPVEADLDVEPDLGVEDTQGISRDELAQAVSEPVLDEGGLWDPLPVTLPTYVTKARARRTVRTIELTAPGTAGVTSSGHDAADSALAREAREAEAAQAASASEVAVETRKVAGA